MAESLNEALNPKPKDDRRNLAKSLLDKYRDDNKSSTELPSTSETISRPQTEELPSTILAFERPHFEEPPSTSDTVDVLPSTLREMPSTKPELKPELPSKRPQVKNVDGKTKKILPSTPDRHNNNKIGRFDNRIRKSVIKQIKEFCVKFDFSQKEFVEMSAVHFIEMWTAKNKKNVDGLTAHDDGLKMKMFKTAIPLINLYRAYNPENKWKFRDDEVARQYNQTDPRIVELGIIQTQFNANFKRINSFEYFKNEIESYIEQKLGEDMIKFLLEHYRKKWSEKSGREVDYSLLSEKEN